MKKFRNLRADEIEVRIQSVKSSGLTLLLYKNSRTDMDILDETVGEMNWQRKHLRDNQNCIVSIWDKEKNLWIEKEDTGVESNTEKEKGLASDSFKRACFNWGIGRELYTSPFIWIGAEWVKIVKTKDYLGKEKFVCYDKFAVSDIVTEDGKIKSISIINLSTGNVVFGKEKGTPPKTTQIEEPVKPPQVSPGEDKSGKTCPHCNKAKMIYNPKTGKYFCEDKCWLNPKPVEDIVIPDDFMPY